MPPERRYQPTHIVEGTLAGTFVFVFATVFALLWLSASIVPVFLLVTAYIARTFIRRASYAAAIQRNQTAVNLLNSGRVDEAAAIFDDLTRTERGTPAHAVYVFNRAVAYMLQGRPRRAYSLFNAILRSHAFHFGSQVYLPLLHVEVATCLALMGELNAARAQRDMAAHSLRDHEKGRLVFVDCLLYARSGRWGELAHLADARYREAESLLRVPTLKALRVLHAMALERMGQHRSSQFSHLVDGLRPTRRDEFTWFAADWPELRAFLEAARL